MSWYKDKVKDNIDINSAIANASGLGRAFGSIGGAIKGYGDDKYNKEQTVLDREDKSKDRGSREKVASINAKGKTDSASIKAGASDRSNSSREKVANISAGAKDRATNASERNNKRSTGASKYSADAKVKSSNISAGAKDRATNASERNNKRTTGTSSANIKLRTDTDLSVAEIKSNAKFNMNKDQKQSKVVKARVKNLGDDFSNDDFLKGSRKRDSMDSWDIK